MLCGAHLHVYLAVFDVDTALAVLKNTYAHSLSACAGHYDISTRADSGNTLAASDTRYAVARDGYIH